MNRFSVSAFALLVIAPLAACSEPVQLPSELGGSALDAHAPSAYLGGLTLNQYLEREKERIKLEQELSKPRYDSLKVVWETHLKTKPGSSSSIMMCDPLQYSAQVKIIGPEGGDVDFGPHKLMIPKGALLTSTAITAEMPVALRVGAKFSPHGLTFLAAPRLILSYKHCTNPSSFQKATAYIIGNEIVEWTRSIDQQPVGLVESWLWHFSDYALAIP